MLPMLLLRLPTLLLRLPPPPPLRLRPWRECVGGRGAGGCDWEGGARVAVVAVEEAECPPGGAGTRCAAGGEEEGDRASSSGARRLPEA